jgi:hypothetical protein
VFATAYYLLLPIFWFTQYKERHAYEFDCNELSG